MTDGTELPADLVVYATGYGSMNGWVADLIDQEMADKVGKVWGLGSDTTKDPGPWEGEQRNMWKPTQQEALWFHGGNLHQSRHYSLFLALQLKARTRGHRHARLRAAGGPPHEVRTGAPARRRGAAPGRWGRRRGSATRARLGGTGAATAGGPDAVTLPRSGRREAGERGERRAGRRRPAPTTCGRRRCRRR